MSIYDYKVKKADGTEISLNDYRGKVLLIINSATECGFTPQYDALQDLYEELGNANFEILDFPCNQFGNQAPGSNEEIMSFCNSRYGITFPIFSKIDVNGDNQDPLFKYLKSQKGFEGFDPEHPLAAVIENVLATSLPNYKETADIKWNFTKFLIDQSGNVLSRFEATKDMSVITEEISALLSTKANQE